jgi:hypothetical protein
VPGGTVLVFADAGAISAAGGRAAGRLESADFAAIFV